MNWFVYIIINANSLLYIGITTSLDRRLKEHNTNKGARWTRGRGPFQIAASFPCQNRSEASKLEYKLKQLSREEKLEIINGQRKGSI